MTPAASAGTLGVTRSTTTVHPPTSATRRAAAANGDVRSTPGRDTPQRSPIDGEVAAMIRLSHPNARRGIPGASDAPRDLPRPAERRSRGLAAQSIPPATSRLQTEAVDFLLVRVGTAVTAIQLFSLDQPFDKDSRGLRRAHG